MPLSYDDLFLPFRAAMKPPPEWRIGAEAEKFGIYQASGAALPYDGDNGVVGVLAALESRFGWKPIRESNGGPLIALERNRASVTLEPGGQLELSGAPLDDIHAIVAETDAHLAELHQVCDPMGSPGSASAFTPSLDRKTCPGCPSSATPSCANTFRRAPSDRST